MNQYTIKYYTPEYMLDLTGGFAAVDSKTALVEAETEQAAVNKFEQMYENCFYISVQKAEKDE